jgi:hypothetical protein
LLAQHVQSLNLDFFFIDRLAASSSTNNFKASGNFNLRAWRFALPHLMSMPLNCSGHFTPFRQAP